MVKQTIKEKYVKQIEYSEDYNLLVYLFAILIIGNIGIWFVGMLTYNHIQSQINELPKKVCWNETENEEIQCPLYMNLCIAKDTECLSKKNHCFQNVTKELCRIK